jgi:hypothetical protein
VFLKKIAVLTNRSNVERKIVTSKENWLIETFIGHVGHWHVLNERNVNTIDRTRQFVNETHQHGCFGGGEHFTAQNNRLIINVE